MVLNIGMVDKKDGTKIMKQEELEAILLKIALGTYKNKI